MLRCRSTPSRDSAPKRRVLGFRALGFRVLGFRALGFLGFRGLGL